MDAFETLEKKRDDYGRNVLACRLKQKRCRQNPSKGNKLFRHKKQERSRRDRRIPRTLCSIPLASVDEWLSEEKGKGDVLDVKWDYVSRMNWKGDEGNAGHRYRQVVFLRKQSRDPIRYAKLGFDRAHTEYNNIGLKYEHMNWICFRLMPIWRLIESMVPFAEKALKLLLMDYLFSMNQLRLGGFIEETKVKEKETMRRTFSVCSEFRELLLLADAFI